MSQTIKGNRPLRIFAGAMIGFVVVGQLLGQIDLLSDWIFWPMLLMSANALQASITGFCPMFKNANGDCAACGVACDAPTPKVADKKNCCSDSQCGDEGVKSKDCCSTAPAQSCCDSTKSNQCCEEVSTGCCEPKTTGGCCEGAEIKTCCDDAASSCCEPKETSCCGSASAETLEVKVLGTGCASCDNTVKLIQATAASLGVAVTVVKVEDVAEIASYGVMSTPGVVINDVLVHSGGIPSKNVVEGWLKS